MTAPPTVPYFQGMFANEDLDTSFFALAYEIEATCHHEAAHAVADYMFGCSLESIGVSASCSNDDLGELGVMIGGEVRVRARSNVPVRRANYCRQHFELGCAVASGPAGERRFRHEAGLPMRMLGSTESDHNVISSIGRTIEGSGRCRHAFARLVWHAGQTLIARDDVWKAVEEIAADLFDATHCQLDYDGPGTSWAFIEPSSAYAACRRHGLKQGMLRRAILDQQNTRARARIDQAAA